MGTLPAPQGLAVRTVAPEIGRGTNRQLTIPSCALDCDSLGRLFALLQTKANEAAELEVAAFRIQPGQTQEQLDAQKNQARFLMELIVRIQAATGEWTIANIAAALDAQNLPTHVATIEFESALRFRTQLNRFPGNSFHLVLDFSRTGILDLSNPSGSPTPNQSRATVAGSQITWVNGVYEELSTFFKERARRRNWLHSSVVYDALLITVGFPASFSFVYRVNQWLKKIPLKWPDALYIAFYVYVVLVSLYTFRFLFNYARWVFPKLDGPSQSSHSTSAHRFILAGLVTTLIWHLVSFVVKQMMGT